MSKNFELLSRAGWRQDYFEGLQTVSAPPAEPDVRATNHGKKRLSLPNDTLSNLVRKVFLDPKGSQPSIVAFAGVARRAGCTWTCVHAAKTLARYADGKVCIVDANFEAPVIHKYFSTDASSGLSDALLKGKSLSHFAVRAEEPDLWYLPSGSHCGRMSLLSESMRVESYLQGLATDFDWVLIDAPALTSGRMAVDVCKSAHGAVLVMEPSGVTAATLARARALLASTRVKLLGVVLNQRESTLPALLDRLIR